jgi:RNase P subunit RPR2
MVKVVGIDSRFVKRVTCRKCSSVLEYTENEVRNLHRGMDYGGGPDGADGFNCPNCGQEVYTKSW